jgi:hypothetical protein
MALKMLAGSDTSSPTPSDVRKSMEKDVMKKEVVAWY